MLTKALQVWGLTALNVDSEEVQKDTTAGPFEAHKEQAFICNLQVKRRGCVTVMCDSVPSW